MFNPDFVRTGCVGHFKMAILPKFLIYDPHLAQKGCTGRFEIAISTAVFDVWPWFGAPGRSKIHILPPCLDLRPHQPIRISPHVWASDVHNLCRCLPRNKYFRILPRVASDAHNVRKGSRFDGRRWAGQAADGRADVVCRCFLMVLQELKEVDHAPGPA